MRCSRKTVRFPQKQRLQGTAAIGKPFCEQKFSTGKEKMVEHVHLPAGWPPPADFQKKVRKTRKPRQRRDFLVCVVFVLGGRNRIGCYPFADCIVLKL